jgi:hypothetical protein
MRVAGGDRGNFLSVNGKKVAIVIPESSSCYVKEGSDGNIKIDGAKGESKKGGGGGGGGGGVGAELKDRGPVGNLEVMNLLRRNAERGARSKQSYSPAFY